MKVLVVAVQVMVVLDRLEEAIFLQGRQSRHRNLSLLQRLLLALSIVPQKQIWYALMGPVDSAFRWLLLKESHGLV